MLKTVRIQYYKVKEGQTLRQIAEAFSVSEWKLAKENALIQPPCMGQVLKIPNESGNAYIVREGDTKELLCGSEETFRTVNGTDVFYIGMRVILD